MTRACKDRAEEKRSQCSTRADDVYLMMLSCRSVVGIKFPQACTKLHNIVHVYQTSTKTSSIHPQMIAPLADDNIHSTKLLKEIISTNVCSKPNY